MSLAEEVAAISGAGDLAKMVREVENANPQAVQGIAKRWRGSGGDGTSHMEGVGRKVRAVDHAWRGRSADDFVTYMGNYSKAAEKLSGELSRLAGQLDKVATALSTAKTDVTNAATDLVADVRTYKQNNPHLSGKQQDEKISSMAQAAADRARPSYNAAKEAVRAAAQTVSDVGIKGITIPAATGQLWRPDKGHKVVWTPIPDSELTKLAGGTSPNGGITPTGGTGPGYATNPGGSDPGYVPYIPGGGTGADIVNAARKALGRPYVWGANGPNAFDCSGLVYWALNQAGIKIGDTTADGYQRIAKPISPSEAKPGDLVFYGNPAHHVGIYIGNGKMIVAPHTGDVVKVQDVTAPGTPTFGRIG